MEILKKLLAKLNGGNEIEVTAENLDEVYSAIVAKSIEHFKKTPDFKNLLDEKRKQYRAETLSEAEKKLITEFGIDISDFNEAGEVKRFDFILQKAKANPKKTEAVKELEEKLMKTAQLLEEEKKRVENINAETANKIKQFQIQYSLQKTLAQHLDKSIVAADVTELVISDFLAKNKAQLNLKDDGTLELLKEDGTSFLKEGMTASYTLDEFIEKGLKEKNIFKQSNGAGNPPPNGKNTPANNGELKLTPEQEAHYAKTYGADWKQKLNTK